jgi:hypothetical protein
MYRARGVQLAALNQSSDQACWSRSTVSASSTLLTNRAGLSPPLVYIGQHEQVQAGEQQQGEYGHCRKTQPVVVPPLCHSNAVDDDRHCEGYGQPAVGLPHPSAPVQLNLHPARRCVIQEMGGVEAGVKLLEICPETRVRARAAFSLESPRRVLAAQLLPGRSLGASYSASRGSLCGSARHELRGSSAPIPAQLAMAPNSHRSQ